MYRRTLLATGLLLPITGFASAEKPVAGEDYIVLTTPCSNSKSEKN